MQAFLYACYVSTGCMQRMLSKDFNADLYLLNKMSTETIKNELLIKEQRKLIQKCLLYVQF